MEAPQGHESSARASSAGLVLGTSVLALLVLAGVLAWALLPTPLPSGATSLSLSTAAGLPIPAFGCASAQLQPVRVERAGGALTFRLLDTGELVRLIWPAGYSARLVGERGELVDHGGAVVAREGDILLNLGGNQQAGSLDITLCLASDWSPRIK